MIDGIDVLIKDVLSTTIALSKHSALKPSMPVVKEFADQVSKRITHNTRISYS